MMKKKVPAYGFRPKEGQIPSLKRIAKLKDRSVNKCIQDALALYIQQNQRVGG